MALCITERQKFCNFTQITSHTLKLFMKFNETLIYHSETILQENSNINTEIDHKVTMETWAKMMAP